MSENDSSYIRHFGRNYALKPVLLPYAGTQSPDETESNQS